MISKKTKAITAGILTAAMSASSVVPALTASAAKPAGTTYAKENGADASYAKMFESLYDDVVTNGQANGYLSKNTNGSSFGIPYHGIETLIVEAPDYGHESTSEAMSYITWMAAMHDVLKKKGAISASSDDLAKAWATTEAMIPGWSKNAYGADTKYDTIWDIAAGKVGDKGLKADALSECPQPQDYPEKQEKGGDALNPIAKDLASAYSGTNGYYLMHWLADVDDWYGFGGGTPGAGNGKFTFINTFQRGEQESCFETVPQPCLEELKYGSTEMKDQDNGNGIKAIFNGDGQVPKQYAFTNAPDAEDRAIQAVFFANQFGVDCGEITGKAGVMGDQCRNDMFDKFYKKIGIGKTGKGMSSSTASKKDSQHYLMAWYTSWGGQLDASWGEYQWAWQIGCSHSHQFYQNPLAAYALAYDPNMSKAMKATSAVEDYEESFKRQLEMYLWLQSADGPFAGGCTNSKNGNYSEYSADDPLFYEMAYVEHPVYADPGSNHWIGNQVWSMQRLAELYYYIKTTDCSLSGDKSGAKPGGLSVEDALEKLIDRWVAWFIKNTDFDDDTWEYAIPASLDWTGKPATWTGTYDENANSGLTCTITAKGNADVGCVSSLCNTLVLYAAANGVKAEVGNGTTAASTTAEKGLVLANKLMTSMWLQGRDEKGISFEESNGSLKRIFEQEVFIPSYYKGEMPDGSPLDGSAKNTFSSIRKIYEQDPMYKECKAVYDSTGETEDYKYHLHRFWHQGDAIVTIGMFALLYPEVDPWGGTTGSDPTEPPTEPTTPPVQPTTAPEDPTTPGTVSAKLWGDANEDSKVNVADAVAVLQYICNQTKYALTEQGLANADLVDPGKGITGDDVSGIQKLDASLITQADCPLTADQLKAKK